MTSAIVLGCEPGNIGCFQLRVEAKVPITNQGREWFNVIARERGMTQGQIATACGVNIRTLRAWLDSERIPESQIDDLCRVMQVSCNDIAAHFTISEAQPGQRRGRSSLAAIGDITLLLRVVVEANADQVRLGDLEAIAAMPFNFEKLSKA